MVIFAVSRFTADVKLEMTLFCLLILQDKFYKIKGILKTKLSSCFHEVCALY